MTVAKSKDENSWKLPRVAEIGIVVLGLGGTGTLGYGAIENRLTTLEETAKENQDRLIRLSSVIARLDILSDIVIQHPQIGAHAGANRRLDKLELRLKYIEDALTGE